MDAAMRQAFLGLEPLASSEGVSPVCKVCGAKTRLFDVVDFYKHCCDPPDSPYQFGLSGIMVPYYRCGSCRFLFTDLFDDWDSAELAEFIYNPDYLKVDPEYVEVRPRRTAMHLAPLLASCKGARILDYGSGSGAFAAAMRTYGFTHMASYDPFSSPAWPSGTFDLITCVEVLEHAAQPTDTLTTIAQRLTDGGAILIGQTLQPENIEELGGRWWYLAPRNGHVSLFAHETFVALAGRAGLRYQGGSGVFAFTRGEVAEPIRGLIQRVRSEMLPEIGRRLIRARWQWRIRRIGRRLMAL